ncbi:hypothetical protein B649_08430 [Candidatus Sulfuricurvum sp. RIFRC-1]|uniref:glycosyltransferase family 4 protein n=1 Tax=Candidatus Sulfuricurvum sp. RIFRC-1 TaxID=1249480 RepID=UPI0002996E2D|nr:glycosyltransferase family 4 protein [Candidatus Sulfuricurvum sp. RIFRC-1]AFV97998.1 hypothetical protein B649_08430 [Candidatus Sulfuricurvum sp. RIFRC-1]
MLNKRETIPVKICIWENIASPHQSYFFQALTDHPKIDLQVRYFERFHDERTALGWKDNDNLPENEQYVIAEVDDALDTVEAWEERIHIVPGLSYEFTKELLNKLIKYDLKWIHWSERSGIGLARKLHYNVWMFNLLQPFASRILKSDYANKINKYAMGVFAQGHLAKQDFIGWGVQKNKIEHLFYTIDKMRKSEKLPDDLKKHEKKLMFLYAGSLDDRKGITVLLNAFSKLQNSHNWLLILVGQDKSDGGYVRMAINLGINVVFTGSKSIEIVPQYICSADVFVLPTLFDGWGAVINEAAALGKPMISTDQCGAAFHLIQENKNGFRVQAGNSKALAKAMQFYIDNPNMIDEHGKNSEKIYHDEFTPEKNVQRFLDALQKWQR